MTPMRFIYLLADERPRNVRVIEQLLAVPASERATKPQLGGPQRLGV